MRVSLEFNRAAILGMDAVKAVVLDVSELEVAAREAVLRVVGLEATCCQFEMYLAALVQAK